MVPSFRLEQANQQLAQTLTSTFIIGRAVLYAGITNAIIGWLASEQERILFH